jgi:hypothetical protein
LRYRVTEGQTVQRDDVFGVKIVEVFLGHPQPADVSELRS